VNAAEGFVGLWQPGEAGRDWLGGVHRVRGRFSSGFCRIRRG
jgi:hypothetical protein